MVWMLRIVGDMYATSGHVKREDTFGVLRDGPQALAIMHDIFGRLRVQHSNNSTVVVGESVLDGEVSGKTTGLSRHTRPL